MRDERASEMWRQGKGRQAQSSEIAWESCDVKVKWSYFCARAVIIVSNLLILVLVTVQDAAAAVTVLQSCKHERHKFPALKVKSDFPQYMDGYERSGDLEMWLIGATT